MPEAISDHHFAQYRGCLSHLAFNPTDSQGRERAFSSNEMVEQVLDPLFRDVEAIMKSKAIRRLHGKSQVLIQPENPHIRSRSVHTLEVVATARRITHLLGLNEQLAEAVAWGHDLGHPPYGHLGEIAINQILSNRPTPGNSSEFKHELFGVALARQAERQGRGLNLTFETLAGMLFHSSSTRPPEGYKLPLECEAARLADKMAYLYADVNDAKRGELPYADEIVRRANYFGANQRDREQNCQATLLEESVQTQEVSFKNSELAKKFFEFKDWMQQEVYNPFNESRRHLISTLQEIHDKFLAAHDFFAGCDPIILLASLTDNEADHLSSRIRNRRPFTISEIKQLGISELVPFIQGRELNYLTPNLDPALFSKKNLGACLDRRCKMAAME